MNRLKIAVLVVFTVWSVVASRPFCRVACPLGAFYALFSRVRLVQLSFDAARCNNCNACHQVCPMGIRVTESANDPECILCLSCTKACKTKAVGLSVGGMRSGCHREGSQV